MLFNLGEPWRDGQKQAFSQENKHYLWKEILIKEKGKAKKEQNSLIYKCFAESLIGKDSGSLTVFPGSVKVPVELPVSGRDSQSKVLRAGPSSSGNLLKIQSLGPAQDSELGFLRAGLWSVFSQALQTLLGFPGGSAGKESACNAGDLGLISGLGRSSTGRDGNPLQYSCLENPMDREAWWAMVHSTAKSRTRQKRLSTHHALYKNVITFLAQLRKIWYSFTIFTSVFLSTFLFYFLLY